jgi:hypothetical protein
LHKPLLGTIKRKEKKMNMHPSFIDIRSSMAYEFTRLRARALRDSLWAKLTGRCTNLARFPEGVFQTGLNRKLTHARDIPVEEIIGTLYRHSDFDDRFRPLKKNLRDRWVNILLIHHSEGWPPILVHKVGDHYYVEDGHHRVSVARALGIAFIEAKVWEYPNEIKKTIKACGNIQSSERNSAKKYITVPE